MKTIMITGHGTGIGKTYVCSKIAGRLLKRGRVQVIKPLETGITFPLGQGDVNTVLTAHGSPEGLEGHTFWTYEAPLAPVPAAELVGEGVSISKIVAKVEALPRPDYRIIDGCGGIAVPMDVDGRDHVELAKALGVDRLVLVVENKLGAINQARMLAHYVKRGNFECGFWLNMRKPASPELNQSNMKALEALEPPLLNEASFEDF